MSCYECGAQAKKPGRHSKVMAGNVWAGRYSIVTAGSVWAGRYSKAIAAMYGLAVTVKQ